MRSRARNEPSGRGYSERTGEGERHALRYLGPGEAIGELKPGREDQPKLEREPGW